MRGSISQKMAFVNVGAALVRGAAVPSVAPSAATCEASPARPAARGRTFFGFERRAVVQESSSSARFVRSAAAVSQAGVRMAVEIAAATVKELRERTGAGMMDCKKALQECNGDMDEAAEFLRKKGIVSAEKKASRAAKDGLVATYIHHSNRLGVLVEVNCETDFVARRDEFREIVNNIAMQIAASETVEYVSRNEIPEDVRAKEVEIEMKREDLAKKPENIRSKIVEGRVDKLMQERCLLEQPFLRDDKITVEEYIKQGISLLGENIQVRRFAKFVIGA
eukprot:tig00021319_g20249.t1